MALFLFKLNSDRTQVSYSQKMSNESNKNKLFLRTSWKIMSYTYTSKGTKHIIITTRSLDPPQHAVTSYPHTQAFIKINSIQLS